MFSGTTFLCPRALQDTALALWFPSLLLAVAEAVLSGRCCLVALVFRGIGPCARGYGREQVRPWSWTHLPGSPPKLLPLLCLEVLGSAGNKQAVQ